MAKNANHEGSIIKRKDGRWMGRITTLDGKRKHFYGRTRQEVWKRVVAALRDQELGVPVADDQTSVAQFLDGWLENTVKPSVRPRTYEAYESKVRLYIRPAIGRVKLAKLAPQHVQRMLNDMEDAGLSPQTRRHARTVLRTALGCAVKWQIIGRNAAALVDAPAAPRRETTAMTIDQARQFLDCVDGDRYEGLYNVALTMGMRQGEILGLRWVDVDFDRAEVRVRHALQRVDGELRLVEPKSKSSRRTLALPAVVAETLVAHRARQRRDKLAAGGTWPDNDLVFTTEQGLPLDGVTVTKRFQRMLEEADLPRFRFHDLRHTCATLMIAMGVSPRVVMEQLGHSRIGITMDVYAHVLEEQHRDAANRMDALLA